jgi:hypothetical protein
MRSLVPRCGGPGTWYPAASQGQSNAGAHAVDRLPPLSSLCIRRLRSSLPHPIRKPKGGHAQVGPPFGSCNLSFAFGPCFPRRSRGWPVRAGSLVRVAGRSRRRQRRAVRRLWGRNSPFAIDPPASPVRSSAPLGLALPKSPACAVRVVVGHGGPAPTAPGCGTYPRGRSPPNTRSEITRGGLAASTGPSTLRRCARAALSAARPPGRSAGPHREFTAPAAVPGFGGRASLE